jgi:LacI family transcriptional regulator
MSEQAIPNGIHPSEGGAVSPPPSGPQKRTMRDVAKRAGVSVATVSRVLAGTDYRVSEETREKVLRAARDMDFVLNAHARALSGAHARAVAFVVSTVAGPSFAAAAQGVEEEAAAHDRLCLVCTTHGDESREDAIVELMREQRADAVIFVGGSVQNRQYRERIIRVTKALDSVGSRLVFCGRPAVAPGTPGVVVEYANESGSYEVTEHLIGHGHERIVFLGGLRGHNTATERLRGYRRALRAHDIELDPALVRPGNFTRESGYAGMRGVLAAGLTFTAVFAATDMVAAGAMQALREAKIDIPGEVSIVGYDDIPQTVDMVPALTTVHVPYDELGRAAVRLALAGEGVAQQLMLGTRLVVRDSVRAL